MKLQDLREEVCYDTKHDVDVGAGDGAGTDCRSVEETKRLELSFSSLQHKPKQSV